jgi:hypothetical protein
MLSGCAGSRVLERDVELVEAVLPRFCRRRSAPVRQCDTDVDALCILGEVHLTGDRAVGRPPSIRQEVLAVMRHEVFERHRRRRHRQPNDGWRRRAPATDVVRISIIDGHAGRRLRKAWLGSEERRVADRDRLAQFGDVAPRTRRPRGVPSMRARTRQPRGSAAPRRGPTIARPHGGQGDAECSGLCGRSGSRWRRTIVVRQQHAQIAAERVKEEGPIWADRLDRATVESMNPDSASSPSLPPSLQGSLIVSGSEADADKVRGIADALAERGANVQAHTDPLELAQAIQAAPRIPVVIAYLTDASLAEQQLQGTWLSILHGAQGKLLPIRADGVEVRGLLAPIVSVREGKDPAATVDALIEGVQPRVRVPRRPESTPMAYRRGRVAFLASDRGRQGDVPGSAADTQRSADRPPTSPRFPGRPGNDNGIGI